MVYPRLDSCVVTYDRKKYASLAVMCRTGKAELVSPVGQQWASRKASSCGSWADPKLHKVVIGSSGFTEPVDGEIRPFD